MSHDLTDYLYNWDDEKRHYTGHWTGLIGYMSASRSQAEWNRRKSDVILHHNGQLPPRWHEVIVASGLERNAKERWETGQYGKEQRD